MKKLSSQHIITIAGVPFLRYSNKLIRVNSIRVVLFNQKIFSEGKEVRIEYGSHPMDHYTLSEEDELYRFLKKKFDEPDKVEKNKASNVTNKQ